MKRIIVVTLTVLAALGLSGSTLKSFEVTATTCVPGDAAQREDTSIDGREATFKTTDGDVFFIRSGGTADHRLLHNVFGDLSQADPPLYPFQAAAVVVDLFLHVGFSCYLRTRLRPN